MWEIIDKKGLIHSGDIEEMVHAFDVMCNPDEHSAEDVDKYQDDWHGDLKLIQVHKIHK